MTLITKLKSFYQRNERYMVPGVLLLGVVIDFITFRSIELKSAFMLLAVHWFFAGSAITFLVSRGNKQTTKYKTIRWLSFITPLIVQFSFGATLSAAFIFYWFSGSFTSSWPFFLLVGFLMIANETFREYYLKPGVQLSVSYFISFSLLSVFFPYLLNSLSAWVFILSGITSLAFMLGFLHLLSKGAPLIMRHKGIILLSIFSIFGMMNLLYFTNLIPPIPLSLVDAGVYHDIERVKNTYFVQAENKTVIGKLLPGEHIHIQKGNSLHALTSIFAPSDLSTVIVHEWQRFDQETYSWEAKSEVSYTMTGGRDQGYRGFSQRPISEEGLWRVRAKTTRGQVVGSIWFFVSFIEDTPRIITIKK